MAEIKAFQGLRYTQKAGDIASLCCPPYDIVNGEQRETYLKQNPNNIIRLELPKFPLDSAGEAEYQAAADTVHAWISDEILKRDEKPGIYIYEMEFEALGQRHAVKGFIALVKLEEFSKGIILPHEETLSKAKTDRLNLMTKTNCNFSQIYSLYRDETTEVWSLIESHSAGNPTVSFTDEENVTHRLWCVYDEIFASQIQNLMEDKQVYIADGHHRYETALNYYKQTGDKGTAAYVPMMLVNMENPGLVVFPTHRIVRNLDAFDANALLKSCEEYFEITQMKDIPAAKTALDNAYGNGKKAFILYEGGRSTLLTLKDLSVMKSFLPDASDALAGLDVSVLHTLILERLLGIDPENMKNQKNLVYTKQIDEAVSAVDNGEGNCAFILNPTRVEEIRLVSLAGEKMPQKSTYFYPKLTTGLVMNRIF